MYITRNPQGNIIGVLALALLLTVSGRLPASTLDDIAALAQHKTPSVQATKPASPPVWFRLSDGRTLDISRWQIVHFVRSDCPYCRQFNPVLRAISEQTGLPVFTYSFDGIGDDVFPQVIPVTEAIISDFFPELPRATPTDFLLNKDTLVTIPLSQGAVSGEVLMQRIDETFALAARMGVL